MKKLNRIVSILLAVLMLLSSVSFSAFAEEDVSDSYEYDTNKQILDYLTGQVLTRDAAGNIKVNTTTGAYETQAYPGTDTKIVVDSAQERLDYMDLRLVKGDYRLYVDAYSGEVAVENTKTGQILFSNPYDVGATSADDTIKAQLLSQIVVKYQDITLNNTENTFYSYTEAAERGQIDVRSIRNGIRVEYSIGREQAKMLVPMVIERSSFEQKILKPLVEALSTVDENGEYDFYNLDFNRLNINSLTEDMYKLVKFKSYFLEIFEEKWDGDNLDYYKTKYPLLKKMDFYIFDDAQKTDPKLAWVEQMIKTYAPDYTFDDLDEDHLLTGYEAEDKNPPLFRMALEYTLTEDGLSVRLPANGIRFNEMLYRLTSIDILPYMGAGSNPGEGYSFFPDGSGALFDFEKIQESGATTTVTNKVYGQDFAYHTITGKHQEDIRYPVYGMVDSYTVIKETGEEFVEKDYLGKKPEEIPETAEQNRGFFAIIEEGEAMMEITAYHETTAHKYNSVKVTVYPRPQDTYNVADAISVSGVGGQWTVVSSRKYTGGYRVKYIMLTPDDVAQSKGLTDTYDCTYVGMALAYRDYLVNKGILTKLTSDDVKKDIPLYIETFGTIPTIEKILSIPVTVMTPLTSFEDIQTMYDDFSSQGVSNINFIMTGYNDGGMYSGVAYDIDWERSVGGKKGFTQLVEYASEKGFGLYPDFDFVYHSNSSLFDGVTARKHLVKTIDNRYANKREYSSTKQTHLSYFELLISPAYFNRFYEHLTKDYKKFNPVGISVSTLGNSLNSDFDEDEPYNREDSKKFTVEAFQYLNENYDSVMTSGGNSFAWKYVDHITDIALDSSRYSQAGAAVPFLGIVLHGYVQFAGEPINMEGNINYAFLKAIENGAALKFIVSYRNTENLKDFEDLSKYYSIRYDIWFDDVVSIYQELNSVLADVQTSAIVDHFFVEGTRVADMDEMISDSQSIIAQIVARENEKLATAQDAPRIALRDARLNILNSHATYESKLSETGKLYNAFFKTEVTVSGKVQKIDRLERLEYFAGLADELVVLQEELAELEKPESGATAKQIADQKTKIKNKEKEINNIPTNVKKLVDEAYKAADTLFANIDQFNALITDSEAAYELLNTDGTTNADLLAMLKDKLDDITGAASEIEVEAGTIAIASMKDAVLAYIEELYTEAVKLAGDKVVEYVAPEAEEDVQVEETAPDVFVPTENTAKYDSDDNKIAYVEYENGVAFLLNFNNYAVRAELNGKVYFINAYDYIVVGKAN